MWFAFLFSLIAIIWPIYFLYQTSFLQNCPHEVAIFGISHITLPEGQLQFLVLAFLFYAFMCMCIGVLFLSGRIIFGKNTYAVIASDEGLWLDRYGLLPWDSIEYIYVHRYGHRPHDSYVTLAIQLKNIDFIKRRASWLMRFQLFTFSFITSNGIHITYLEKNEFVVAIQLRDFMLEQRKIALKT